VAVDAATGTVKWHGYALPDQGPGGNVYSGASVWGSTPTIDPTTNTAFIGTGQNCSIPDSAAQCETNGGTPQQCLASWDYKDSILALDLTTGAIKWATGPARFDTWNFACLQGSPPNNCPNPGPDHDTSDGTHLFNLPQSNGTTRRAVGAGQKSGQYWMLDAGTGQILWSASVGPGSSLGGIEWGTATDGQRVFFTETDRDAVAYQLPNGLGLPQQLDVRAERGHRAGALAVPGCRLVERGAGDRGRDAVLGQRVQPDRDGEHDVLLLRPPGFVAFGLAVAVGQSFAYRRRPAVHGDLPSGQSVAGRVPG
jgi:outer membrane protein assembly factor BamB